MQVQNGTEAVSRARNAIKALTAIQFVRGKKRVSDLSNLLHIKFSSWPEIRAIALAETLDMLQQQETFFSDT